MPSDRLAEAVLAVVGPPERAAATVGDLLELASTRGRLWFWGSILRTALAIVWRHFLAAPFLLTFYAAIALLGYILVWFLVVLALTQSVLVLWFVGEAVGLTNNTTGAFPAALLQTVQPLVTFVVAPYVSGRRISQLWDERAIALTMALVGCLLMLALVLSVQAADRSIHLPILPLFSIVPFMMAGVVRQRVLTLRRSGALTTG